MDRTDTCWRCKGRIDAGDAFCRCCGSAQGKRVPFRYTHAGIIILTLLFGPLALPFIWKSPKLDKKSRIVYFSLNLLITVFMIYLIIGTFANINHQVQETIKILDQTGIGAGSGK